MYIDGYLLFTIYFIAVLALIISAYALWSLEEIRQYYARRYNKKINTHKSSKVLMPTRNHSQAIGYFDKFISK
jgi:CHASE3 domain sensor protein